MKVEIFNKNNMGQNVYLAWCEETTEGVLIDAGCSIADENAIMETVNREGVTVKAILLTHGHFDHIIGIERMKTLTDAPVYCHASEKKFLENPDLNLSCRTPQNISVMPDELLNDGDIFAFGKYVFKVLHTPGHTPGCVCFYNEESGVVFAGDTLFKSSIGRTDFPLSDHSKMMKNIKVKLLTLPEETVVYTGHGESTTIGREKKSNPFLKG